jgi:hypothetical protein
MSMNSSGFVNTHGPTDGFRMIATALFPGVALGLVVKLRHACPVDGLDQLDHQDHESTGSLVSC